MNKVFCYKTALLIFLMIQLPAKAQDDFLPRIVPPSPEAASLGKYADIPVSYYTGVPSINIPLYTIDYEGYLLPISLSYHASGIKVNQEASWVGLGWVLNAGGVVYRTVIGRDDFAYRIGNNIYPWPDDKSTNIDFNMIGAILYPESNSNYPNPYEHYGSHARLQDGEPDIFTFNFNGRSGKFIYTRDGVPVLYPHQDLMVEGTFSIDDPLIITDEQGIKYYFEAEEQTKSVRFVNSVAIYDNTEITAYYLSRIVLPNLKVITFNYNSQNYQCRGTKNYSQRYTVEQATTDGLVSIEDIDQIQGKYLTSIVWETNRIEFETSNRTDLADAINFDGSFKPQKLNGIHVYYENQKIKSFRLNSSYFNDGQTEKMKRLRLDEIFEVDNTNPTITLPPWEFSYCNSQMLKDKTSLGDHWGYHNIISPNSYGIPPFSGSVSTMEEKYFSIYETYPGESYTNVSDITFNIFGANRSSSFPEMKAGILERIIYPTGGSTIFEYEPNTYTKYAINESPICLNSQKRITSEVFPASPNKVVDKYINLTETNGFLIHFEISGINDITNGSIDSKYEGNKIKLFSPSGTLLLDIGYHLNELNKGTFYYFNYKEGVYINNLLVESGMVDGHELTPGQLKLNNLPIGNYRLSVEIDNALNPINDPSSAVMAVVSYFEKSCLSVGQEFVAGGLRIKSKTDITLDGLVPLKTEYHYSGGVLYSKPKYHSVEVDINWRSHGYSCRFFKSHRYLKLSSGNLNIFNSGKSHIGYEYVTENKVSGGVSNGHMQYKFDVLPAHIAVQNIKATCNGLIGSEIDATYYSMYFPFQLNSTGNCYFKKWEISYDNFGEPFIVDNIEFDSYPFVRPDIIDEDLGNLLEIKVFDSLGNPVKKTTKQYDLITRDTILGLKVYEYPYLIRNKLECEPETLLHIAYLAWYNYTNSYNRLVQEIDSVYFNGVAGPIQTNSYFYNGNNHLLPTSIVTNSSTGELLETKFRYPGDICVGNYLLMKNQNLISPVIERIELRNNLYTGGHLTTYKFINGIAVRDAIFKLETTVPFNTFSLFDGFTKDTRYDSPEIIYTVYDNYARILEYLTNDGRKTAYTWGYNGQYPTSKTISNGGISLTESWEWYPLIGIKSYTDQNGLKTTYEYDGFGRLNLVKDHNNSIVKKYTYHYKQ
jgi:YD repeat-containing protein